MEKELLQSLGRRGWNAQFPKNGKCVKNSTQSPVARTRNSRVIAAIGVRRGRQNGHFPPSKRTKNF